MDELIYASARSIAQAIRDKKVSAVNAAKFWIAPIRLQSSGGFSRSDINRIQRLIEENQEHLLRSWNEFFAD